MSILTLLLENKANVNARDEACCMNAQLWLNIENGQRLLLLALTGVFVAA